MIGPKQVTGGRALPDRKSFKSGQTAGFIRKKLRPKSLIYLMEDNAL